MSYIWQNEDWTSFYFDKGIINTCVSDYLKKKSSVNAIFKLLSPESRKNMHADFVTQDAISTSKLEGIEISYDSVYSSIAKALDIDFKGKAKIDKNSENLSSLMLEALDANTVLNEESILQWHKKLFSGAAPKSRPAEVGCYRKEAVYVIRHYGNMSQEVIYEGVPYERVQGEMDKFFAFLKNTEIDDIIKSAIASFYFVTIHPFLDGNGRLSRLIADNLLTSYDEGYRVFSISTTLLANKKAYYDELYKVQHSDNLDITSYIKWYISMVIEALDDAEKVCENKIRLSQFIMTLNPNEFNSREIMMLYKLASGSFVGKLTAEKWTKMMKCKPLTSSRDLAHLVEKGMLVKNNAAGTKTSYSLNPSILREV